MTIETRWAALCESVLGRPATAQEQNRLARAIYRHNAGQGYNDLSAEQRARQAVRHVRDQLLYMLKDMEGEAAQRSAREAAAGAVDSEFVDPEIAAPTSP